MTADALITLVVLVVMGAVLVVDLYPSVMVLGGAVVALLLIGVADAELALIGFASPAPATIAALYVVAGAATATGAVGPLVERLLAGRRPGTMLVVAATALSAIVPNTPLVAMLAPRVVRWSQRRGISASRLLMPLSFATLLGGTITMIGTSTNLVVADLMTQAGVEPIGLFEIGLVGVPVAIVGVVVLSTVCPRLLPDRTAATQSKGGAKEFQMAAVVDTAGPLVGRTIAESGLRTLDGVYLAMIERAGPDERGSLAVAATPDTRLEAGDVCCFVGDVSRVLDLHDLDGLTSLEHAHILQTEGAGTAMFEAVVAPGSTLVGTDLRTIDFRRRYGGAVLAISRADESLGGQLGRIPLRAGDVLLVLAPSSFATRWRSDTDFSVVASIDEPPPTRRGRLWLVATALIGMIAATVGGVLPLFEAAVVAALVVVAGGVIDAREGWRSINLHVVATMAISISLGRIVAASGLADNLASLVERLRDAGIGDAGTVALVLIVTIVLTEILTNAAAAALMVPIAVSLADGLGVDPRMLSVAVLIGASTSFLTPTGYQTHLMVWGLGGYRFTDFARVGAPLTLSTIIVATITIPFAFG